MRPQVKSYSVGIQIPFVVLCGKTGESVPKDERAEHVAHWNEKPLIDALAGFFENRDIRFHLLCCDHLVQAKAGFPGSAHRHCLQAIVVT